MIIVIILVSIVFYIFNKYKVLEKLYTNLINEKTLLISEINHLQEYKRDITKTFRILDNELGVINEHINIQKPQIKMTPINYVLDTNIIDTLIQSDKEKKNEEIENKNEENEEIEGKNEIEVGRMRVFDEDINYEDYKFD